MKKNVLMGIAWIVLCCAKAVLVLLDVAGAYATPDFLNPLLDAVLMLDIALLFKRRKWSVAFYALAAISFVHTIVVLIR